MRKSTVFATALCGCSRASPGSVEPPPPTLPPAAVEVSSSPTDVGVADPAPQEATCPRGAARDQLDACLAEISPSNTFVAVEDPPSAFGYVCVLFGTQGNPRCREGEVVVIRRWRDNRDPDCPKTLTVYWAPMEGSPSAEEQDVPDSHLRMRSFPSDGTQFSFIRLDDHMAEATSCLDATEAMQALLVDWSTRLMTEHPATGS